MSNYAPIDCHFYDRLEALAVTRAECDVRFRLESDQTQSVVATIEDVYSSRGEEFLRLSTGDTIRLDRIVAVVGHELPDESTCDVPNA